MSDPGNRVVEAIGALFGLFLMLGLAVSVLAIPVALFLMLT